MTFTVQGIVTGHRHSHVFAEEVESKIAVLIPRNEMPPQVWILLTQGARIEFEVGVNFKGLAGRKAVLI